MWAEQVSVASRKFIRGFPGARLSFPIDFVHDGVPVRIIGQGSLGAKKPVARRTRRRWRYRAYGDFHVLALGKAQVFIQLNRLAVYFPVKRPGHGMPPVLRSFLLFRFFSTERGLPKRGPAGSGQLLDAGW